VEVKRLQELGKRISTVPEAVEMQSRQLLQALHLNFVRVLFVPFVVEMKRLQELAKRISTVPEAVEMQSR
ncbi:hypothetical protein PTA92_24390, partial [Shigella sonnei]|nr:hypothetical protein [Shigella sonnei]